MVSMYYFGWNFDHFRIRTHTSLKLCFTTYGPSHLGSRNVDRPLVVLCRNLITTSPRLKENYYICTFNIGILLLFHSCISADIVCSLYNVPFGTENTVHVCNVIIFVRTTFSQLCRIPKAASRRKNLVEKLVKRNLNILMDSKNSGHHLNLAASQEPLLKLLLSRKLNLTSHCDFGFLGQQFCFAATDALLMSLISVKFVKQSQNDHQKDLISFSD